MESSVESSMFKYHERMTHVLMTGYDIYHSNQYIRQNQLPHNRLYETLFHFYTKTYDWTSEREETKWDSLCTEC